VPARAWGFKSPLAHSVQSQSFLEALGPADVEGLHAAGSRRAFDPGELLCREGDAGAAILVVIAGHVKLTKTAPSGRATMLELRGPGDVLGEMSVLDGAAQSANAIALDRVEVLVVGAARFDELRRERASIANALLAVVVRRLRQATARQHELGTTDVIARVCARLVELADAHGEPTPDGLLVRVLSQQELADWAGVSRDGVVRALHELRDAGLVDSGRGRVLIKDLAGIRKRAGPTPLSAS
jgi:CRP/FNR family transcriptional regulator, cyclic AMP receptor protein